MADNITPPFRADHVGSLLRPAELLRARAEHQAGRISAEELRRVEDAAIRDVVRMQQEVGLTGRDRRRVPARLVAHGFPLPDRRRRQDRPDAAHPVPERGRHGRGGARGLSHRRQADARQHDLRRGFRLSEIGGARRNDRQTDDPVAVDAALSRRTGGDRRGRLSRHGGHSGTTSPRSTRKRSRPCTRLGCTYLQLDDTSLAYLNDPAQRAYVTSIGGDGDTQHLTNIQADQPGARRPARRHDRVHPYVPRQFPLVVDGRGRLRPCRRGLVRRTRGRRLLSRIRRCALGRVRAVALCARGATSGWCWASSPASARRSKARTS